MVFRVLGMRLLLFLEQFDKVIRIEGERRVWRLTKRFFFHVMNISTLPAMIVLTTAFGDPRDFFWPARCYLNDCLRDVEVNMWTLIVLRISLINFVSRKWFSIEKLWHQHKQAARHAAATPVGGIHYSTHKKRKELPQKKTAIDEQRSLPSMSDDEESFTKLTILFGMTITYSAASPMLLTVLLLVVGIKLKHDVYTLVHNTQRPLARRASGAGIWTDHFHIITLIANLVIPAMVVFVSRPIALTYVGQPSCPIQYVCFKDDEGVMRYNSILEEHRWRVHNSDSTKHWVTWTALVGLGLAFRGLWTLVLHNPSYFVRAKTNEERWFQQRRGLIHSNTNKEEHLLNFEEFNLAYEAQRQKWEEIRAAGQQYDIFETMQATNNGQMKSVAI